MQLRPRWRSIDSAPGGRIVIGPQGNSFSGPHAAGVAALVLERCPDLCAWRVKEILEASAKDLGPKGRDTKVRRRPTAGRRRCCGRARAEPRLSRDLERYY